LIVVDAKGQILLELTFSHTAEGWQQAQQAMAPWAGLPVAIETSAGPAVDQLLQRNFVVYPIVPKAAARYRERKRPSGSKDDRHDAWSLAEAGPLSCWTFITLARTSRLLAARCMARGTRRSGLSRGCTVCVTDKSAEYSQS